MTVGQLYSAIGDQLMAESCQSILVEHPNKKQYGGTHAFSRCD